MSNTIQFVIKGVDKASSAFGKVAAAVKRVGIVAAAAGAAIFAMVNSVAKAQDQVGKMSIRLGIATDKLSALHRAASLGGVSIQTMNMGIQRMSRRIAEASQGTGEAVAALKELKLNAIDLARLPLDEQMNRVADALAGVESQSDKVRLAFKLFDSEGVALLQTMEKGSQSFKDAADEAERLGVIVSAEAAARSAAFSDSWDRVTTALGGAARAIANSIMPGLTAMNEAITNFIADNRDAIVSIFMTMVRWAVVAFSTVQKLAVNLAETWDEIWDGNFETLGRFFADMIAGFKSNLTNLLKLVGVFAEAMIKTIGHALIIVRDSIVTSISWAWRKAKSIFGGDDVGDFTDEIGKQFSANMERAVSDVGESFAKVGTQLVKTSKDSGVNIAKAFGLDEEEMQKLNERVDVLMGKIRGDNVSLAKPTPAPDAVNDPDFDPIQAEQDRIDQRMQLLETERGMQQEHENMMLQMRQHGLTRLTELVGETYGAQAGMMGDAFATMLNATAQYSSKAFAIQKAFSIAQATVNMFKGISQSLSAYPMPLAAVMAAAHGALGLAQIKGIKAQKFGGARVAGGAVTAGSSFLVGESGPEMFTPNTSGRIANNDELSTSAVTVQNVNVSILPNATNADALLSMSQEEMERVVAGPIIRALNSLSRQGIEPETNERLAV